jgi:hypothetical protein
LRRAASFSSKNTVHLMPDGVDLRRRDFHDRDSRQYGGPASGPCQLSIHLIFFVRRTNGACEQPRGCDLVHRSPFGSGAAWLVRRGFHAFPLADMPLRASPNFGPLRRPAFFHAAVEYWHTRPAARPLFRRPVRTRSRPFPAGFTARSRPSCAGCRRPSGVRCTFLSRTCPLGASPDFGPLRRPAFFFARRLCAESRSPIFGTIDARADS